MDISRTGARVAGTNLPRGGEDVRLRVGKVEAAGEVVRSDDKQCALAFDMPIAAAEVNRVRTLAKFVQDLSRS